uniref:Uncharacterized protein n=2 Tax=Rhizobium meliloti TaxID=382 RepID=A4KVP4_SINMM|nr:hypothetical protein [Sinorhizobium meliloti]ABN47145.1 hypothetical protein [Sinorhizobium meliloti SM11]
MSIEQSELREAAMRYWEACEANVTADEAIAECARHQVRAVVRSADLALVNGEIGDVIALADHHGEYYGGDVLGYLGY